MSRPLTYMICTVQRSGSLLLCETLTDTEVCGSPPGRHFLLGVDEDSSPEHFRDQLTSSRNQITSPNGIAGFRMFWNGLPGFVSRVREAYDTEAPNDHEVLQSVFNEIGYLWLRRNNKVRQAVSFWRATTGREQFRYPKDSEIPVNTPAFDFDRVDFFVRLVTQQEEDWRRWFSANNVVPFEVSYELLAANRHGTLESVLDFLGVESRPRCPLPEPRVIQQADEHTERYVQMYEAHPSAR